MRRRVSIINYSYIIPILIVIIVLSLTVVYSSFGTNLLLSGEATVRVESDIRVTGVRVSNSVSGALSSWEEYNVDNISSNISLPNSDSKLTYYVTITNYGNVEAGIDNVSGLPSNLSYSIANYNFGNTLCDDNDGTKCTLGSVSTLAITIGYANNGYDSSNTNYTFVLDFIFNYIYATARIGDKYYDSVQNAVDDVAKDNVEKTIVLLKNSSEVVTISEGQNIVFDFQKSILSNSGSNNVIKNYGTLKIISGTISTTIAQGAINNYGDLYVSGGSIRAIGGRQAIYNDGGNVTISGTAHLSNTTNQRAVVQNQAKSTLTILGGTIVAEAYAAVVNNGTLVVGAKDGNVNTSSPSLRGATYGISSGVNFSYFDGVIRGKTSSFSDISKVKTLETGYDILLKNESINSVSYQTAILAHVATVTFNPNEGAVSEVTRDLEIGSAIGNLPIPTREDYVFLGWFTAGGDEVDENAIINNDIELIAHWIHKDDIYVAMIGDNKYHFLQEAVAAAPNNTMTTIKLIDDTREKITIGSSKNIVLDTQNYTLANIDNSAVITNSGTLSIIGGTITSSSINTAAINNTGTLTISGGSIMATGLRQAVYNDGGNTTISGSAYLSSTTDVRSTVHNLTSGTLTIVGGTIVSSSFSAVENASGTVTLGIKDGNINTSSPNIRGVTYGVVNSSVFKFYDGIIKGITGTISGSISDTESNSSSVTSVEVIDGNTYNTLHLN